MVPRLRDSWISGVDMRTETAPSARAVMSSAPPAVRSFGPSRSATEVTGAWAVKISWGAST